MSCNCPGGVCNCGSGKGCMCFPSKLAKVLVTIGGLNWGLVGLGMLITGSDWNVVHMILGSWGSLENIVYVLVGISAVVKIVGCPCKKCKGVSMEAPKTM